MACGSECNQEVGDALRATKTWLTQNNQASTGDPVNVVTGAFQHSEQDVALPNQRLSIALDRHYNNQHHWLTSEPRLQPFGAGWTHSFNMRLNHSDDGTVSYFDDRGSELIFAIDAASGSWIAPPGSLGMTLSKLPGCGFQLRQITGLSAEFNAEGRLLALNQPGPRKDSRIDLIYDAEGRLTNVSGAAGRGLNFTYYPRGHLIREVRDHSGRRWCYKYNHYQELEEVCDPSGRCRQYDYREWTGRVADGRKSTAERTLRALRTVYAFRNKSEEPPGSPVVTNWYTTEQRVYLQEDAIGSRTRFEYNPFTRTTVVTDPVGQSTVYCFDESGSTTKVRKPGGSTTEYLFDLRRNLLAVIDPLGHRTEFVDFEDPQMLAVQAEFGHRAIGNRSAYVRFTEADIAEGYDVNGNRPLIRNALGFTTKFRAYTAFGKPTEVLLPDGTQLHVEYDDLSGLPLKLTRMPDDENAGAVQFSEAWQYDDFGCCTKHCVLGERPDGTPTTSVQVEVFEYDECLQLVASRKWIEQNGGGASSPTEVQYEWDILGRVVKKTVVRRIARNASPEYRITQFGYDCLGRLVWESLPDSSFIVREYDVDGHITESFLADPTESEAIPNVALERRFNRCRWIYDDRGLESRFIDPTESVTTHEWDSCGRCTRIVYPSGLHTTFSYDLDGNVMTEVSSLGHETRFGYDAAARFISRSDNLGYKLFLIRDAVGRTVRASNHPDAEPGTQYEYDALGRITSIRHADSALESFSYDFYGNVCQKRRGWYGKKPDSVESYDFDASGRLCGVSAGSSEISIQKFRYEYHDDEREIWSYDAIGNMTASCYDSEGALIERSDADGRVLNFTYDDMGQVVRRWSDDDSVDSRYSYNNLGLLREATEPGVSYQWDYDPSGRVRHHCQNVQGRVRTVEYVYDDFGRLTDKRLDDRWWVHLAYSSSHLPREISFPGHSVNLDYDPAGRLIAERWHTGGHTTFRYSVVGALTDIQCCDDLGEVRWEQALDLDERERPWKEGRRSSLGQFVLGYGYDALNRLDERNTSQGKVRLDCCRYEYDEQNNCILRRSDATTTRTYKFDAADRLVVVRDRGKEASCIYDRSGLLLDDGTRTYKYDAAHRLREVAVAQTHESVIFQYSATGELVLSTTSDNSECNFYDDRHQIVREGAHGRQDSFWSLRTDCLMAFRTNSGAPSRVYTDLWASVLGDDRTENLRDYDPFGEIATGVLDFDFGFGSKPYESLSGLYFNRARFYDPKSGRFTQPDPSGTVDGPNVYAFARNNPMYYGDPDGTDARHQSQGRIAEIMPALAFFPGQKEGRTYIKGPGLFDFFEKNVHAEHFDANFNRIGRSYIVAPGFLESKPHVEHFDLNWNRIGRSYIEGPGFLESSSHFQHYDADWSRSGKTYSKAPGFLESQPHFQHYDSDWERTGKTYFEGPGLFESHSHFRRYA